MIAALFVEKDGPYAGIEGIEVWDKDRDARNYSGPNSVICHPPCERWGRYWGGGPSVVKKKLLGDDGGNFARGLWSVRTFGGVLEHPEASHAWQYFGLNKPPKNGGWVKADKWGLTCCVEQGHYGHAARKATWLYGVGIDFKELKWGPSKGQRLDEGFHSAEERRLKRAQGQKPIPRLSKKEKLWTPIPFRDLLLSMFPEWTHIRGLGSESIKGGFRFPSPPNPKQTKEK